jgi:CHAT domain-containing protein
MPLFTARPLRRKRPHQTSAAARIVLLAAAALFLWACAASDPGITLDEAQRMELYFGTSAFVPPTRSIDELNAMTAPYEDIEIPCTDSPLPEGISDTLIDSLAGASGGWGRENDIGIGLMRIAHRHMRMGNFPRAIDFLKRALAENPENGPMFRPDLARCYAYLGEFSAAKWAVGSGSSMLYRTESGRLRVRYGYASARGVIEQMQGNYALAESYFQKALEKCRRGKEVSRYFYEAERAVKVDLAKNLLLQGRLTEAEALVRAQLKAFHLQNRHAAPCLLVLSRIYMEQNRFEPAFRLADAAERAYIADGAHCSSLYLNLARHAAAEALMGLERWGEALAQYETIRDAMMPHTPEAFESRFSGDPDWALALLAAGRASEAAGMLKIALAEAEDRYGSDHVRTSEIRGLLAVALLKNGDRPGAEEAFERSFPNLVENRDQTPAETETASDRRLVFVLEHYMSFLADTQADRDIPPGPTDPVQRCFQVAETIRSRRVQQDVAAGASRAAAGDPELAALVRKEQDLQKQLGALERVLTSAMGQRQKDWAAIDTLKDQIRTFTNAREVLLEEIERKFPTYADLMNPMAPAVDALQRQMRSGEAVVSFYIGKDRSYIWAILPRGEPAFHTVPLGRTEVRGMVFRIRGSLEPESANLRDLAPFALDAAFEFYRLFLEPVKDAWSTASHLIVIPHGPAGHLPLALLPTAPAAAEERTVPLFSEYRKVSWLIRSHRISVLPTAETLLTLRALPPAVPGRRAFAGFGDPVFKPGKTSPSDLTARRGAAPGLFTRAVRVSEEASLDDPGLDSVDLRMLQPLPDTRDEILGIAAALDADPEKDVFLGAAASEKAVKTTPLAHRRVLVFATHGLMAGDLDGLHQPALALSHPAASGDTENDGLLTMEEIFGLKLDADWVVLSACNTGAGDGAGAEAVSGLGRAFFYAGARALLVSNWPVESESARALTTGIFRRQAQDPTISKAEAVRQAMVWMIDEGAVIDPNTGQPLYTYAHPIFWAPFSVVGD